jgi:Ca2+ transporting ATPase
MVTGDNKLTAKAIAKECHILNESNIHSRFCVLEGTEFNSFIGGVVCKKCKT